MYDPEAVYQDADILQAQYEAEGNRLAALQRKGICTHGHVIGKSRPNQEYYYEQLFMAVGEVTCTGCGYVFASDDEWDDARSYPQGFQTDARKRLANV
jgi:hypothetical protein